MAKCKSCGEEPCSTPTFCATMEEGETKRAEEKERTFGFIDGDAWNEPPPAQEWTVDQRFPRRETVLFSGNGGAGKSTIGLHLCCAHALGKDWMGALPEPGAAMFVDAEDDEKVIWRRTYAIAQHYEAKVSEMFDGGLKIVSLHGRDAVLATAQKGLIVPTDLYKKIEEAAALFEPQTIVIASAANFYGGNEIDRSQVTQFIGLMNRLAAACNGSVVLISHPSVLGMENDSGISGSTQWHNAVRARMYLKSAKKDDEPQTNGNGANHEPELRQLEFRKNQYGPKTATVTVRWRDGLFLPEAGPSSFDRAVRESQADAEFSSSLAACEREGFIVSATPKSNNYAPHVFAQKDGALKLKLSRTELADAMARLMAKGKIQIVTYGKPSHPHHKLSFGVGGTA